MDGFNQHHPGFQVPLQSSPTSWIESRSPMQAEGNGWRRNEVQDSDENGGNTLEAMMPSEDPTKYKDVTASRPRLESLSSHAGEPRARGRMREKGRLKEVGRMMKADEIGSSSGSTSTLTQGSYARRGSIGKPPNLPQRSPTHGLDPLIFLDASAPGTTNGEIHPAMHTVLVDPLSSSDSATSGASPKSALLQEHETDLGTSPEGSPEALKLRPEEQRGGRWYGPPDMPTPIPMSMPMPQRSASLPHFPESPRLPRPPGPPGSGLGTAWHVPQADMLPLTGYELLASCLTAQATGNDGPRVRPMYRKFETLNHRLLLHLQDELCELEDQLHRLDTVDTQNRRLNNTFVPASRRAEFLSSGELHWHKTDILGKIGFKLEQYNRVLASFKATESMPKPTLADIDEYRGFLSTYAPVAEVETRFINATEDLVCVADQGFPHWNSKTPVPSHYHVARSATPESGSQISSSPSKLRVDIRPVLLLGLSIIAAIVMPVITFNSITGYVERMVVVFLTGLGLLAALVQTRVAERWLARDYLIYVGAYGLFVALVAGGCHYVRILELSRVSDAVEL